jgi:hypothetical protein
VNQVEPITRTTPAGPTAVPQVLEEYLAGEGYRWSWQPDREDLMSVLYGNGIVPLRAEDIKEGAPEVYAKVIDPGEPGTKRLFITENSGRVKMGDCILMIQKSELFEQMNGEWQDRMNQMQNVVSDDSDSAEVIAEAMRTLGIPAGAKTTSRSMDEIYRSMMNSEV